MRAVLCTNGGLPGAAALRSLRSSGRIEIAGIVNSTRILSPRYGFLRGAWEQYRLSGLRYTVYLGCTVHAPVPRHGLPAFSTRDINGAPARAFIERLAPELIVSAFFNQRMGEAVRAIAPAVNLHPALLPAFKGVDPVFYSRLRGAPLGVTLHRVSPELDAGDILAQRAAAELPGESVLGATVRLFALGAQLLADSLEAIRAGGTPQAGAGSYDSWPARAEVAALRRKGVSLVRLRDLLAPGP